MNTCCLGF